MDINSVVLQALQQADAQANQAASNLAVAGTGSSSDPIVDTVSLSDSMVALMSAENLYAANIATLNTADQAENAMLNVLA